MRNPEMTKIRDRKMVETFYLLYDKKRIRLEDVLLLSLIHISEPTRH